MPLRIGNQPPSGILSEFDARNATSITMNGTAMASARAVGHCHSRRMTTKSEIESISIASVTAIPYAPARLLELLNPITSRITAISSAQLMNGM